jgi:hypothetical protein
MKLFWGDTKRLRSLDWAQIEINVNDSSRPMQLESVVVRAALWGRKFGAFEMFVPVERVRPSGMELVMASLFARTSDLMELRGIESVWGIDGIVKDGSGNILKVPSEFVEEMAERERKRNPVRLGAFVRILWGPERMLCGTVGRLSGKMATVDVETRSRKVKVTLPVTAVETLHTSERDYFYRGD